MEKALLLATFSRQLLTGHRQMPFNAHNLKMHSPYLASFFNNINNGTNIAMQCAESKVCSGHD